MLMEDHLPSKLVNCSSIRRPQGISMQNRAGHDRAPTLLRRGGWLVPASRQIEALLSVVLCCSSRLSSGAWAHELRCDYCWCWLSRYHGRMIQMIHYPHYHSMHTSAYLVLYLSLCAMQCVWLSISEMHDIWHIWFDKINWKISKLDLVFFVFPRPVQWGSRWPAGRQHCIVPCPRIETLCTGVRDKAGFGNNAKYPHMQNRDAIRGGEVKPRLHSALLRRPARDP